MGRMWEGKIEKRGKKEIYEKIKKYGLEIAKRQVREDLAKEEESGLNPTN